MSRTAKICCRVKNSHPGRRRSRISQTPQSKDLRLLLALLLLATFTQAQQPYPPTHDHPPPAWFIDVAAKAGITVRNVNGSIESKRYIIEATGSGVAILDYDRDGWPDIFLVNGTTLPNQKPEAPPTNHLFHNNHDGTFTDVTAKAGILSTGWGQGACVGDYDNDGYGDIFVTGYGKNRLFHNQRNGTFKEVAEQSGVAGSGKEWGTGCAFVDYDRDGKLDIAIANYVHFDLAKTPAPGQAAGCIWKGVPVMCGPRGLESAPNLLFHNLGNGKFEDVSKSSGFEKTLAHYCFSITTLDYNEDGWADLYVACDSTPSILYRNNGDGTFTDVGADAAVAFNEDGREQAGMGSTAADYDGDGKLDIFKTNFSDDTSTLYRNNGDGTFTDMTYSAGLGINTDALGWGAMFADVDNNGWPDLLVVNGHVYPEVDSAKLGSTFREPRFLYYNLSNGRFKDLSKTSGPGLTEPLSGRGLAIADLFNDGRLEAVVNNLSDRPMLLVNVAKNQNHWLGLAPHRNHLQPRRYRRTCNRHRHKKTLGGRGSQRLQLQLLERPPPPLRPRPRSHTHQHRSPLAQRHARAIRPAHHRRPTHRPHRRPGPQTSPSQMTCIISLVAAVAVRPLSS